MSDTITKSLSRSVGMTYARTRWMGRAKNGKGRLFSSGGATFAAAEMGAEDARAFEAAARETWDDLRTAPVRP